MATVDVRDPRGLLVLTGPFGERDAAALSASCRRLGLAGASRLILDVGAVTHCDEAGLACWSDLVAGSDGPTVAVVGARWSQFLELMRRTPVGHLGPVCEQIRRLVSPAPRSEPRGEWLPRATDRRPA